MALTAYKTSETEYQNPAYADTLAVTCAASRTIIQVGTLTGNITINATVSALEPGDVVEFLFLSDASIRTVTFNTGFGPSGTLATVANNRAYRRFVFDGTDLLDGIEA